MDAKEKRIRQRLKDDFPHYARKCLKIRTKTPTIIDGRPQKIIPFELNTAQLYLHKKIEEQKAATGKVRALLLKGRQQGCCLTPDTLVLKSDYSWSPIDDIHPGDSIISVDEDSGGTTVAGRKKERRFRKAKVEFRGEFVADVSVIELSNGTVLKSTSNHRWLVQQRGGSCTLWRETGQLQVGDHIRAAVHNQEADWSPAWLDGWVGGILDADGSCATTAAARVSFSQVDNVILRKYKEYLRSNNIKFYETVDNRTKVGKYTKLGDNPVHCVRVDAFPDIAKLLSKTGPCRFDIQHTFEGRKLPKTSEAFEAWPEVLSIRCVGPQRVIDLQTSTKTFIAEGMVSHNSTYVGGRYYHKTTFRRGVKTFILAHMEDATSNLFKMVQRYHEHCPGPVKPSTSFSNRRELVFNRLDSAYGLGTAGSKNVGRSDTIDYLHGSEVAFWEHTDDIKTGVFQAAEMAEEIILESTANGLGNMFHQMWQDAEAGKSDYTAIFIPWYWQDEYRKEPPADIKFTHEELQYQEAYGLDDEQLYWRRMKIIDLRDPILFKQEYPCIAKGERIGTSRGMIPIEEVVGGDDTAYGLVRNQWGTGIKPCLEITTRLGYTLKCTQDHRIRLSSGKFKEARLLPGERVQLSRPKFASKKCIIQWYPVPCVKSQIEIDNDFGFFLGLFMGDGSLYHNTLSIVFDDRDENTIDRLSGILQSKFGIDHAQIRKVSKHGVELRTSRTFFAPLFRELGIIHQGKNKRRVCVPECVFRSPKQVVAEFLKGFFDADGFAAKDRAGVKAFSKYNGFLSDIQYLLLGFGITSKLNHVVKKAGNGSMYPGTEMTLRGQESRTFGSLINFESHRKRARVARWVNSIGGQNLIPMVLFDEVISVKPIGDHLVYDIEMESGDHVFDAHGVETHNCNAAEAFQVTGHESLISPETVLLSRKTEADRYGAYVVGCDPAREGDDMTAFIRRQGRVAWNFEKHAKLDDMAKAGLARLILDGEPVDRMFIDRGGGSGMYDRLVEMGYGHRVSLVNFGSGATDSKKYKNRRAEMWGEMRAWLESEEATQIPDEDYLQADLVAPGYKYTSTTQLQLEAKVDIKKRTGKSPDGGDALALTFAEPVQVDAAWQYDDERNYESQQDTVDSVTGY